MKTSILALSFLGLCAASTSAQQTALIHGQKVVLDKDGSIIPQSTTTLPPSAPLVGGSDSCATPDVVVGFGTFAFNNTAATTGTEGQAEAACLFFTLTGITTDVWFTWTAPTTGLTTVQLCGLSTMDSKVAVYNGTACPTGAAIACNDDSCGLQSLLTFNATAGNSYVVQLGNYPGQPGAAAQFSITQPVPAVGDDCSAPIALAGPGLYTLDNTGATTGTQGQAEAACLFFGNTGITSDLWYTYTATANGSATFSNCGLMTSTSKDSKIAVYAGAGCPTAAAIVCNDDDGAACVQSTLETSVTWSVTCGTTYTIQVGHYPGTTGVLVGQVSLTEVGTACSTPPVAYCFGDGSSTACPCGNAGIAGNGCASSVNANGANLASTGSSSIASDTLVLNGTGMPNSSALYFQGTTQVATLFGDGLRCAGGSVIRLGTKANAAGGSSYPVGADLPIATKGLVTTPGTRTYQCWYRNSAAFCTVSTFNLTNGLLVTWN